MLTFFPLIQEPDQSILEGAKFWTWQKDIIIYARGKCLLQQFQINTGICMAISCVTFISHYPTTQQTFQRGSQILTCQQHKSSNLSNLSVKE